VGNREPYEKNTGVFKKAHIGSPPSPGVRHAVFRGKAAATWTGGAYEGVREHGQGATCLRACARSPSGRRREAAPAGRERRWPACRAYSAEVSSFGYEGRELRRRHRGIFQHFYEGKRTSVREIQAPVIQQVHK
jgi:hypothetical protein